MKIIILIFIVFVLYDQCLAQKCTLWKIKHIKTNYIEKGPLDKYNLPLYLKGKHIQIQDSLLILTEIRKKAIKNHSGFLRNLNDTMILKKRIFFKRQKDDEITLKYPGDEIIECTIDNDTCFASESFLNLLEIKDNDVNAYLTPLNKYKSRCILFILKENNKMVLYSEDDFLLLFLKKIK